ncbi:MAG: site-specific integrase [Pseudohongiellaceae bacterium]
MFKYHPDNERMKRKYFIFLKEAKRQDDSSVDAMAKAISRFEEHTKWKDFKAFHFEQAVAFKRFLANHRNEKTGKPLSKATINGTLRNLKAFFQWLAMQTGYKSRINYTETEYFNLSEKDSRIATASRSRAVPTLEQIRRVLAVMPDTSDIEKRNKALVAFTILTGARDSAIASLKLKHIDLCAGSVFQDAREVKTKASKTFTTYFFPVGEDIKRILHDWVSYLKGELLFGNDDPLFPKTSVIRGNSRVFEAAGVKPEHWSNAAAIRKIFAEAFEFAGLTYFNPHSFRNTLVQLGETVCQSPEEFKAWSQNLGHEGVLTTFYSYGEVQESRQSEIFRMLQKPRSSSQTGDNVEELAKALAREMRAQSKSEA